MADRTSIEWTATVNPDGTTTPGATWNPITGCSIVSPGCTNCYAMRLAGTRLQHHWSRKGLTRDSKAGPVWTGEVRFNEEWLDQPLRWKRPRRIFVCAHGDLFAEGVPDEWIDRVFAVMQRCLRHHFLVLTKRPARMRDYVTALYAAAECNNRGWYARGFCWPLGGREEMARDRVVPFPSVWLGVSAEDQARADERIPLLLDTPAAKRFISAEPLLGPIDLTRYLYDGHRCLITGYPARHPYACGDCDPCLNSFGFPMPRGLSWVIVGGESGPGARPMHPDWPRSLRDQCQASGVPFFFKQWGEFRPPWYSEKRGYAITEASCDCCWPDGTIGAGKASEHGGNGFFLEHVGKKAAGRLLDGREHSEFPA